MNSDERRPAGQPDAGLTGEWDEADRDGVDDWGVDDPDWDDVAHDDDYDEVDVNDGPSARAGAPCCWRCSSSSSSVVACGRGGTIRAAGRVRTRSRRPVCPSTRT